MFQGSAAARESRSRLANTSSEERAGAMMNVVLSLVMLAAFALVGGAFVLWRRTGEAKQPVLMLILAAIAVINVLIWTLPDAEGNAPVDLVGEEASE
ncbi:hypothetical protein [Erythrobacter sp.]|uniref:hypothetical protein n=1 Tax=Erythrobacter sp. TaxID=1042 RepID=UPI003435E70A